MTINSLLPSPPITQTGSARARKTLELRQRLGAIAIIAFWLSLLQISFRRQAAFFKLDGAQVKTRATPASFTSSGRRWTSRPRRHRESPGSS
jgi:hypothetical protein